MCLSSPLGAPSSQRLLGCPNTAGLGGEAAWLGSQEKRGVDEWFSGYQTPARNWGHVRKECADKQQRWRNKQWNGLKSLKRPVINNRCWSCEQDENTSGQECQGLTHGYTAIYPLYISGTLPVVVIIGVTLAGVEIGSKITPHSLSIYEIIWNW